MKKTAVSSLFYALFLLLGHGNSNAVNAQVSGLNPYDGSGMKNGTKYAGNCVFDDVKAKNILPNIREALNNY